MADVNKKQTPTQVYQAFGQSMMSGTKTNK